MYANVKIHGQNEEGTPILELDLGRDPGEPKDKSEFKEEKENILEFAKNKNGPPVDKRHCSYYIVPEDFKDLISPYRCRGSLRWCHHRCLKRWALIKKPFLYKLCGQPYPEARRIELMNKGVQEVEDKPEEPPNQMSEPYVNGARKPQSSEDDPGDEPPPRRRRLKDN